MHKKYQPNQNNNNTTIILFSSIRSSSLFWLLLLGVVPLWNHPNTPTVIAGLSVTSASTSNGPQFQPPIQSMTEYIPLAQKAVEYLDSSTDPFHAVQTSIGLLQQAGFIELNENDDYSIQLLSKSILPNGKYYYTRNKSTLIAFTVGGKFAGTTTTTTGGGGGGDGGGGFVIIGGHTDSPNLRIKPRSKRTSSSTSPGGCIQVGVECYGGGLWHTWFDRDLGISGRVFVRRQQSSSSDKRIIEQRLIKIDRPILRISNLAIHLQTADERKAFAVNNEEHLSPILCMEVQKALTSGSSSSGSDSETMKQDNDKENVNNNKDGWTEYQEPALLYLLAQELNCTTGDIVDFELCLYDVQKAAFGGAFSEFIHSARLDNLASCFMAVQALITHATSALLEDDTDVKMILLYDHEEVGSTSAIGAASPILEEAITTISQALLGGRCSEQSDMTAIINRKKRRSFVLSSDQAHALHPNYSNKHEKNHQPKLNHGMVIKRNTNQKYATTPLTGVLIREVARKAKLPPVQEFMVRQDCGCGSTIGPAISAATGIRTIDMGCPQLSMHSIRETMGVKDITNGLNLFKAYFQFFREVDDSVEQ